MLTLEKHPQRFMFHCQEFEVWVFKQLLNIV